MKTRARGFRDMGYSSTMIYLTCGKHNLQTVIPDRIHPHQTAKGQEFSQKIPIAFTAASIKCLQKSIQYVAASNTSESKVKIVANIFGGIAKQCNRIKTWFD